MNKVILCVGTSNCIGDSLGPMVGEILNRRINKSGVYILGNFKENVSYQNIDNILDRIKKESNIIVIDSALSSKENIGRIVTSRQKMVIGSALNKNNYSIGNLSIKGIVGENKNNVMNNYKELSSVSEELIQYLSKKILNKIMQIINV